jgi:hypothetical protein
MAVSPRQTFPLTLLDNVMIYDFQERVVRTALEFRPKANAETRARLDHALGQSVQIDGYRPGKTPKAPLPQLALATTNQLPSANELTGAVLLVWLEAQDALAQSVRAHLDRACVARIDTAVLASHFPAWWRMSDMEVMRDDYLKQHPEADPDDVALMLCCLSGQLPIPDEMVEEMGLKVEEEMHTMELSALLRQTLQTLAALPPDATDWELLPAFVDELQRRQLQRDSELEQVRRQQEEQAALAAQRAPIVERLKVLRTEWQTELTFFQMDHTTDWQAKSIEPDAAAATTKTMDRLLAVLQTYRANQDKTFTTLAEKRAIQNEQSQVESQALELYAKLNSVFGLTLEPTVTANGDADTTVTAEEVPPEALQAERKDQEAQSRDDFQPDHVSDLAEQEPEATAAVVEITPSEPVLTDLSEKTSDLQQVEARSDVSFEYSDDLDLEFDTESEQEHVSPETSDTEMGTAPTVEMRSADEWASFLWQRIEESDLPAAYWTLRSLAAQDIAVPLSDWLIAAVQGSWWLPSTQGILVEHLGQIAHVYEPAETPIEQAISAAAGLVPSILAPITGMGSWLHTLPTFPESFNAIVAAVTAFSGNGRPLSKDDLMSVHGEDHRAETLAEYAQSAQRWLDEAPLRRSNLHRANDVWIKWTVHNGPLTQILKPVADGNLKAVARVKKALEDWRKHSTADRLHMTDVELHGKRPRPIDGVLRDRWVNQAEVALQLAEAWCDLASRNRAADRSSGWSSQYVEQLVHVVDDHRMEAARQVAALEQSNVWPRAVTRVLRWALSDLCSVLALETPDGELPSRFWKDYPPVVDEATGLWLGLRYRLLWVADVGLADDGDPLPDRLGTIADALYRSADQQLSLAQALQAQIARQDYRFAQSMLQGIDRTEAEGLELQLQEAMASSRATLSAAVEDAGNAIEQAVVGGLLDDEKRANLSSELLAIQAKADMLNYEPLYRRLANIQSRLDQARSRRVAHQKARWQRVEPRLGSVDEAIRKKIIAFMESVLDRKDTVVADERLARLEEILDRGLALDIAEFDAGQDRDVYRQFLTEMRAWENDSSILNLADILRRTKDGQPPNWLTTRKLPAPRVDEIAQAIDSWRLLKRQGQSAPEDLVIEHAARILRYAGFTFNTVARSAVTWKTSGKDWTHLSVAMSAGGLSPIPQFGSQHPEKFDVICVWERPGTERIGAQLHSLKLQTNDVIMLYFGRLLSRQRLEIMQYTRDNALALAVLDEFLLLFLAREYESRLPAFLRCALPLATVNPYVGTGVVPTEMFFDRAAEKQSLQRQGGASLVYGGRQLGKSALLQQVEREFHHPDDDRFVLREDIKLIGDPASGLEPDLIWRKLREGLMRLDLIDKTPIEKTETIAARIRSMMEKSPSRRVLVLFDEADNFLAADAERSFEVVSLIKALMDDTQRRFKVIFTGLHNVQRYEGIPNQPLAHLPRLLVGPLEPTAARQLIRQPLEALGFRFPEVDETPILGILAYTNYHPGLVQLFCRELLQMLYRRRPSDLEPYVIQRSDIEAVYRQEEVQKEIRLRFDWTLALDPRYQALAWGMVIDQMEERDGFAKTYGVDDLRELGIVFWPAAFQSSTREEFRGYLDEMTGLGVLVRNSEGMYRLRSPNIVNLMGREEDIIHALQELAERPVSRALVADSHRAPLDEQASRYSPLTYAQSRVLNAQRFGVSLIFGSDALGIDQVRSASHPIEGAGKWAEMRVPAVSDEATLQWLEKYLASNPKESRLTAFHWLSGPKETKVKRIEAALKFCQRHQRLRQQWMRVLFIFDTLSTYEWLHLPDDLRINLEQQVDAIVTLQRWNEIGLEQLLKQHNKISNRHIIESLTSNLGGWPILISNLIDLWIAQGGDEPLPAVTQLGDQLKQPDSALSERFRASLGLDVDDAVGRIFRSIASQAPIPADLFVPDLLGDKLSPDEWPALTSYLERMGLIYRENDSIVVEPLVKNLILST